MLWNGLALLNRALAQVQYEAATACLAGRSAMGGLSIS